MRNINISDLPNIAGELTAGMQVLISGSILAARDAAHKIMCEMIRRGEPLPVELKGSVIYYAGPCPAKPGRVIGSAGPTTSGRMDAYTPLLLRNGLSGMIGKGERSNEVKEAVLKHKAVYFGAIGGLGALISKCIVMQEIVAFQELGPEALRRLQVKNMPVTVVLDIYGNNAYNDGRAKYEVSHAVSDL